MYKSEPNKEQRPKGLKTGSFMSSKGERLCTFSGLLRCTAIVSEPLDHSVAPRGTRWGPLMCTSMELMEECFLPLVEKWTNATPNRWKGPCEPMFTPAPRATWSHCAVDERGGAPHHPLPCQLSSHLEFFCLKKRIPWLLCSLRNWCHIIQKKGTDTFHEWTKGKQSSYFQTVAHAL